MGLPKNEKREASASLAIRADHKVDAYITREDEEWFKTLVRGRFFLSIRTLHIMWDVLGEGQTWLKAHISQLMNNLELIKLDLTTVALGSMTLIVSCKSADGVLVNGFDFQFARMKSCVRDSKNGVKMWTIVYGSRMQLE